MASNNKGGAARSPSDGSINIVPSGSNGVDQSGGDPEGDTTPGNPPQGGQNETQSASNTPVGRLDSPPDESDGPTSRGSTPSAAVARNAPRQSKSDVLSRLVDVALDKNKHSNTNVHGGATVDTDNGATGTGDMLGQAVSYADEQPLPTRRLAVLNFWRETGKKESDDRRQRLSRLHRIRQSVPIRPRPALSVRSSARSLASQVRAPEGKEADFHVMQVVQERAGLAALEEKQETPAKLNGMPTRRCPQPMVRNSQPRGRRSLQASQRRSAHNHRKDDDFHVMQIVQERARQAALEEQGTQLSTPPVANTAPNEQAPRDLADSTSASQTTQQRQQTPGAYRSDVGILQRVQSINFKLLVGINERTPTGGDDPQRLVRTDNQTPTGDDDPHETIATNATQYEEKDENSNRHCTCWATACCMSIFAVLIIVVLVIVLAVLPPSTEQRWHQFLESLPDNVEGPSPAASEALDFVHDMFNLDLDMPLWKRQQIYALSVLHLELFQELPPRGVDECDWFGVIGACDFRTGKYQEMELNLEELDAVVMPSKGLPMEMVLLTNLEVLIVQGGVVSGMTGLGNSSSTSTSTMQQTVGRLHEWIPESFVAATPLVSKVELTKLGLSGHIPSCISQWSNLHDLHLYKNDLTGSIPSTLPVPLKSLDLRENMLTNSIPTEVGLLSNLVILGLSHNNLTGPIPSELLKLTDAAEFHLSNNNLSGEIPSALGLLDNGYIAEFSGHSFDISSNPRLTGTIPPRLCGWGGLIADCYREGVVCCDEYSN